MLIRIGFHLIYDVPVPTHIITMLHLHPDAVGVPQSAENLVTVPEVRVHEFIDEFGNRCGRLTAPAGTLHLKNDLIVDVPDEPEITNMDAPQHPIEELPDEVIEFLLGSRYCETQQLSQIAWDLFGHYPPGWPRVNAVCSWIHDNVRFDYSTARSTKTALDVWNERVGVCRDFMHLAIAFCRSLNIPARYATGYLGDFGVPANPAPMDFSAYFEAYLGGRWYSFDARHNEPRIGRLLMARGRDAVDVALTTSFGPTKLTKFCVWTDYA